MKRLLVYMSLLLAAVSCLKEERSPDEILIPSPAQVKCEESSFTMTSTVPRGTEDIVYNCGFYVGKDQSLTGASKVPATMQSNSFSADLPSRDYGSVYYICSFVTNGHELEFKSDVTTFSLEALENYFEFGQVNILSYDGSSQTVEFVIDADVWAGVRVTEVGVCYGEDPDSLSIEDKHQAGVYKEAVRSEGGIVSIVLKGLEDATQYYIRPYIKDGEYISYGEILPFYIPSVARLATFEAEDVTAFAAILSGEVTDGCGSDVTERGFVWVEGNGVPTIESSKVTAGSGLGVMTAIAEGLLPNKKYTFRAYAVNSSGTAYGESKTFTTLVAVPTLASTTITGVTSTTATFNAELSDDGGESATEVGFYYSTDEDVDPTTSQKVNIVNASYQKGEGFSIDVKKLTLKTYYYVKSYAVNSAGTSFGEVVGFETDGEVASILTSGSSDVTTNSAVLSGNVLADNGEKITERGFVWMEGTGNPTIDSNKLKVSGTTGEFTATLKDLSPNKKYSFRAYAVNVRGASYGDVMTFTTNVALPTLSNVVVSSITSTSATFSSKVTGHGGETVTEVGFYYSTDSSVDISTSQKISSLYSGDSFSIEVKNLSIYTKYYVRAYTKNSAGVVYSEVKNFMTDASAPTVQTNGATDITLESAVLSGSIISNNGSSITEKGFVWLLGDEIPTIDSYVMKAFATGDDFTVTLEDLEPSQKYSFRAYAINAKGVAYGDVMTFTTVAGHPILSSVNVAGVTSTTAVFSSTLLSHNGATVTEVGFYYSTSENFDSSTSIKASQSYSKTLFSFSASGLSVNTKYYVKSYATNSVGTTYSNVVSFTTDADAPVVKTIGASEVSPKGATLLGAVETDNGAIVSERGFVWNIGVDTPTMSSHKIKADGTTGDFSVHLDDLEPNTKYSFRAYAINEKGTSYGETMSFSTIVGLPALSSVAISGITATSATFTSTVKDHGGAIATKVGFYYSTSPEVDIESSNKIEVDYSSDTFSSSVEDLSVFTTYYVKSYVTNAAGTAYSEVIHFTTLATAPAVSTVGYSSVTPFSALLTGKVESDNGSAITQCGFLWMSGEGVPTESNGYTIKANLTSGEFTAILDDLSPNKRYSFRAYAVNAKGKTYGDAITFTTAVNLPTISSVSVSYVTSTAATLTSSVTNNGGETVSEVGFYYSTEESVDPSTSIKWSKAYSSSTFSLDVKDLAVATTYYVKAFAVNSAGTSYSEIKSFKTASEKPTVITVGTTAVTSSDAVLSGKVESDNGASITERGFVWMIGEGTPTTSTSYNKSKVEGSLGDFTTTLTGLSPNRKYSYRAYAINSVGTSYGEVKYFTTSVTLPTLSTTSVSSVGSRTASFSSKVSDHGGETVSEVGFYYSTEESVDPSTSIKWSKSYSSNTFSLDVKDLAVATTYYVRSFAVNSAGTSYGEVKSFTTLAEKPVVVTVSSSDVTTSGAVLSGKVESDNGASITERGFVWMIGEGTPTTSTSYNKSKVEGSLGDFTTTLTGLSPNRKYSYRAYAINSVGTSYGEVKYFTTSVTLPTLSTTSVSSVGSRTASFSSKVSDHGGETVSEVGFYYSTDASVNPATSLKWSAAYSSSSFSTTVSDLAVATTYYVRSFAVNSAGTSYGEVKSFTTLAEKPVVTTDGYADVTASTALLSGTIVTHSGSEVTERGFVYLKGDGTPTTSSSKVKSTDTSDKFAASVSGLAYNQKYSFRAYAINSVGTSYGDIVTFSTTPDVMKLTTGAAKKITDVSATISGSVTYYGGNSIAECGICWSTNENPKKTDSSTQAETAAKDFTVTIDGLNEYTTYYASAYVTAATGKTYYGEAVSFTTLHTVVVPSLSKPMVSSVELEKATVTASLLHNGYGTVTDAGFVFSTSPSPTISDNKISKGVQTGEFSADLTQLVENNKYYVRAYATNQAGTGYGEEVSFETLEITPPEMSEVVVTGVTYREATFYAEVISLNNGTLSDAGFVYSTSPNPDLDSEKISCGATITPSASALKLKEKTTYYVRPYATNENGVGYGKEASFTTEEAPDLPNIDVDDFTPESDWD